VIYPGNGLWPRQIPAWFQDSQLIGTFFQREATTQIAKMQYEVETVFVTQNEKIPPPQV